MKSVKMKLIKLKNKTIKFSKKVVKEHLIREYYKKNVLFCTFVLTCIVNSTLLRFFCMHTMENYLSIKPIIADLMIVTFVGSFGYLIKPKNRFTYYLIAEIFFTAICMINSVYYTFYTSFASVSMLSLTQYIGEVGDAVVENVIQLKDLIYLIGPITLIAVNTKLKRINYYKKVEPKAERKKRTIRTLSASGIIALLFIVTLNSLDVTRFIKQWNREYIVMRFGIYIYQANDLVTSLQPKINALFGYDQANKKFIEYFSEKEEPSKNEYSNIFEGKNVVVIHGESMQTNVIGLKFNGQEVTPNLNRLASEGMYFSNFYSQVSVGTSSDTELTFTTSLMPTQSGTAFVSYSDRTYNSIPKEMKKKGYYVYSMHANNADFWNRRAMHESLGYDRFYSKVDYNVTKENTIGLGLSDKEFFKQSISKIEKESKEHDKWYSLLIMLTNHTPFSETEKYGEFDVSIKEKVTKEDGVVEEVTYPYMENTKLGNYFKSIHYADSALGEFIDNLDKKGLLDNTVFILYGDHDARLPKKDYNRLYNYDKEHDKVLDSTDPNYKEYDSYQYELGRKVPFIIWTKDMKGTDLNKENTNVMGMYDVMPTLGNMFGFYNKYGLGHDIFSIKDKNIVVFPNGNWVTNDVYYNSQKGEYLSLNGKAISEADIKKNNEYSTKLLDVSNQIIVFNLLKQDEDENKVIETQEKVK
ncbi:MAG: LTA synthase family protein [Firmicutes bacterium]|nr:LTA synthase family protein [Bacillota bacterium]